MSAPAAREPKRVKMSSDRPISLDSKVLLDVIESMNLYRWNYEALLRMLEEHQRITIEAAD